MMCENFRMETDIMMSWEFAFASGAMSLWGVRIQFIALWAVALQRDWGWSKPLSDHGRTKLRAWVPQRYNDLHRGSGRGFRESKMDEAAEVLAGGPLSGFLVDIGQA